MSSVVCGHEPMLVHTIFLLTLALLGLAKAGQDKGMNRQLTLFGEVVPLENDKNAETVWLRVKDAVKDVGDKFSFTMQRAVYNVEKHVLSIFDGEGNGISVWFQPHPDSQWQDVKPDGVRLGEAMIKTLRQSIDSPQTMADLINNGLMTLEVEKIALKTDGHTFIKWTVV